MLIEILMILLVINYYGIYAVKLLDQSQVPEEQWLAYNVPVEESELKLAAGDSIRKHLGQDVRLRIQEPGSFQWIEGRDAGQEVRQALLVLLIVILIAEQLLAYRLSYHPKRGEVAA